MHGDLYARHLLLDENKQLCGVIDWGDTHKGDPALDLGIAFSLLPKAARSPFRQAYGNIDEASWARARFHALHYALALLLYGREVQDVAMCELGRWAIASSFGPE